MINVICAALFMVFAFCYLTFYQNDYLALIQHFYSSGRNVSHGYVFPALITLGLTMLGLFLQHITQIPIRLRAMNWVPSCIILGLILHIRAGVFTHAIPGVSFWGIAFFLLFFAGCYYVALTIHESRSENSSMPMMAWPNFIILIIAFAFVGRVSNTDQLLHQQLRMDRAIGEGRLDDALSIAQLCETPDRKLSSLSAFALSQQQQLGESFFRYATGQGSDALLPLPIDSLLPWNPVDTLRHYLGGFPGTDMNATTFLEYLSRDTVVAEPLNDYLLTAYLLDANFPKFYDRLLVSYPPKDSITHIYTDEDALPSNYAEALLLMTELDENLQSVYRDSLLHDRFHEFLEQKTIILTPVLRQRECKKTYGDTYWFYYYFTKE